MILIDGLPYGENADGSATRVLDAETLGGALAHIDARIRERYSGEYSIRCIERLEGNKWIKISCS